MLSPLRWPKRRLKMLPDAPGWRTEPHGSQPHAGAGGQAGAQVGVHGVSHTGTPWQPVNAANIVMHIIAAAAGSIR